MNGWECWPIHGFAFPDKPVVSTPGTNRCANNPMAASERMTPRRAAKSVGDTREDERWAGVELRRTLILLALPAVFVIALVLFHLRPGKVGLYGFAALYMAAILNSLRRGPEALLAVYVMYLPLSRLYAVDLAPGLNGTNLLEILVLAVWFITALRRKEPLFKSLPFTRMVGFWMAFSLLSVVTAVISIGLSRFVWDYLVTARQFFDQFIVFFAMVNLIRDRNMARRMVLYILMAAAISYLYGFHEWFGTRGLGSIEKSRVGGPLGQPNEYAAFIIYSVSPLLAYGAYYFPKWRSLRLVPWAVVVLRVLLSTFSRAGYLGFVVEGFVVLALRSRKLLLVVLAVTAGVVAFAPQYLPESMRARVAQTYEDRTAGGTYDRSAEERLLLWQAAVRMSLESPFLGKGFDQFSRLAEDYVSEHTKATDNQNMFLYVSSTSGLPALVALIVILLAVGWRGWIVYRRGEPDIDRIIGLGAVAMIPGLVVVNMFGTHMVDTAVDGVFWVYVAALSHLYSRRDQVVPHKSAEGGRLSTGRGPDRRPAGAPRSMR